MYNVLVYPEVSKLEGLSAGIPALYLIVLFTFTLNNYTLQHLTILTLKFEKVHCIIYVS